MEAAAQWARRDPKFIDDLERLARNRTPRANGTPVAVLVSAASMVYLLAMNGYKLDMGRKSAFGAAARWLTGDDYRPGELKCTAPQVKRWYYEAVRLGLAITPES